MNCDPSADQYFTIMQYLKLKKYNYKVPYQISSLDSPEYGPNETLHRTITAARTTISTE